MSNKEITNAIAVDGMVFQRVYCKCGDPSCSELEPELEFVGWELPYVMTKEELDFHKDLCEVGTRPFV